MATLLRYVSDRIAPSLPSFRPPPWLPDDALTAGFRVKTKAGQALYGLRKQTVEPVFGIIK
jgi:hypothetical protein